MFQISFPQSLYLPIYYIYIYLLYLLKHTHTCLCMFMDEVKLLLCFKEKMQLRRNIIRQNLKQTKEYNMLNIRDKDGNIISNEDKKMERIFEEVMLVHPQNHDGEEEIKV